MNYNIKRWLVASVCCFMLGSGQSIMAQQVIFPQEVQANKAQLESNTNKWTLKNSLLTAKFAKVDGKLIFNGCKEMNLLTSSLRTPKFFIKEFSDFLMPCHQHGLRINLLVQR